MFRGLLNAGWSALQKTGHGHDTILWGELAAEGYEPGRFPKQTGGLPGSYGQTRPLLFLRDLYCVNSNFQQLRGGAARAIGCPTNAAGSRRFRSQNPALFNATGVSDHPYPQGESPASNAGNKVDFARFNDLGNLARELDHLTRVYGSGKHFPIYNTEYGYITRPPKGAPYPSPTTAAYFINWAEYLSYKNPRVKSYMQYLLTDPPPNAGALRRFRQRAGDLQGRQEGDLLRLPDASVHAAHLVLAQPERRGLGRRPPGAVRDARRLRPAARPDPAPVRPWRLADDRDGHSRELDWLFRRQDQVPVQRLGSARLDLPVDRLVADDPGRRGADDLQPYVHGQGPLGLDDPPPPQQRDSGSDLSLSDPHPTVRIVNTGVDAAWLA